MKTAVVGAGIMGRLMAFALVNAGWRVTLFDRDEESGSASCSMAAAGLLTPISELEKCDALILDLGMEALQYHWPDIIKKLDKPIFFKTSGSIVLSHPQDQAESRRFIEIIRSKSGEQYHQLLDRESLHALEPELTKFDQAYYFQHEGNIDNQAVMDALGIYLRERDIVWHSNTCVVDIKPGEVMTHSKTESFDIVLDCRGLGAKATFSDLRGVRGELVWLYAPEVHITRPIRLLQPRHTIYLAPRADSVYVVGASEIESEDMSPISVRSILELLSSVYYLHSGFAEARVISTRVHCRPTLKDGLPKIKYSAGLIAINGLYRHGFLIAPTLVHEVMQRLRGETL